jgi:GNAT superfamily N-acetyltransferase
MPTGHAQQRLTTPQTCADPRNLSCDARIGGERDRRVARRTGTATALGARLDGEVDAFLILALSVYVAPAAGARPERTAVVMGAVLDRLALDDPPPPGLEIVAVRDAAALRAWAQVVDPAEPRARTVEVLASLGLGPHAPLQHRLARRGRDVVGATSFLLHGETVLGQQLAVIAPERRAGIGRALVQAAAREALAAGARIAVLSPTPDTVAFYRLLGFALRPWPRDRSFYLPLPRG